MVGQNLKWALGPALLVLGVHLVAVALTKALRCYSRSRLEDLCLTRGHERRADDVIHHDEATEDAAEALAVLTGLGLAALLAALASGAAPQQTGMLVIVSALIVSVPGYFLAGAIGQVYAESVIDRLWPVARTLRLVTTPLGLARWLSETVVAHLARPGAGTPRPASVEVELPSDGDGTEVVEAELPESVRELIQQTIELTRRDVSELMTPRSAIVTLPSSVSAGTAAQTFRQTGLSRIPVFGENRDDIIGILYAKDLFPRMTDPDGPDAISPRTLVRPAHCVPETKNAYDLLEEFRTRRTQIAIVLDEYGSVAGLITLEDLLEELVGTIDDEHDVPSKPDPLVSLGGTRYEVDATVDLEQLNERLTLRLPTDGDFLTIGGLAFHALGRVPEPGVKFQFSGIEFTVVEVVDHAIRRVRLDLQPREAVGAHSHEACLSGKAWIGENEVKRAVPFASSRGVISTMATATVRSSEPAAQLTQATPPLENGDRLTRAEFERRYDAMPGLKKAELIEGVVYMPSPVRFQHHGKPHFKVIGWLSQYEAATPGVEGADNGSIRLDLDNMPQPDAFLLVLPSHGGRVRISDDDYVEKAPELIVEVAASSVSFDLHAKFHVYRRNEVSEYLVWRVDDRAIDWFVLREGRFECLPLSPANVYQSHVFPGLWLDPAALIRGDLTTVLKVLNQGLATPEHATFAAALAARAATGAATG